MHPDLPDDDDIFLMRSTYLRLGYILCCSCVAQKLCLQLIDKTYCIVIREDIGDWIMLVTYVMWADLHITDLAMFFSFVIPDCVCQVPVLICSFNFRVTGGS